MKTDVELKKEACNKTKVSVLWKEGMVDHNVFQITFKCS
jgi:hypothetical protein